MPATSQVRQRRDSWPPTQVRIQNSIEHDDATLEEEPDLSFIDDNPLTYFLTPAPLLAVDDEDDDNAMMDFDFDAGIEDAKHPPEIVRSVSPSSLDGLSLPADQPADFPAVWDGVQDSSKFASLARPMLAS